MLVNLTPHTINVIIGDDVTVSIPSAGVARLVERDVPAEPVEGVETIRRDYGSVIGLPEPELGVTYVVSGMILDAVQRQDMVAPGTLVRDEEGQIVGCRNFRRW